MIKAKSFKYLSIKSTTSNFLDLCFSFTRNVLFQKFRIIKEKRQSQAAIRNLLDLMSENRSTQSVFTEEGIPGLADSYSSNNNNPGNAPKDFVDPDCSSSSGSGYSLSYCDSTNCNQPTNLFEDRICFPPIDDAKFPKNPSPQHSVPVLPAIHPETNLPVSESLNGF
jgi:hypothetical protein